MGFVREAIGHREVEIVPRLVHVVKRPVMTFARAVGRAGEDRVRMPELGKHRWLRKVLHPRCLGVVHESAMIVH